MNRKVSKVNSLFKETLLYSNKIYFLEAMNEEKKKNADLQEKVEFYEKRHKV